MVASKLPSTILAAVGPKRLPPRFDRRRAGALFFEAVLYTAVAVLLVRAWGERAMIFSIFLAAGALIGRFNDLLAENRDLVWSGSPETKREANVLTASSLLVMFSGVFAVYFLFLQAIGVEAATADFEAALEAASADVTASGVGAVLLRNLLILSSFFVLGFIYQSYGATLAISWTACAWALLLTVELHTQLEKSDRPGWLAFTLTLAAMLPHSILRALGCIAGTLAGIFLSRGLIRYRLRDRKLLRVLGAVALLAVTSIVCLFVAAFLEVTLSRWLLV